MATTQDSKRFSLDDSNVVVAIGSGAGGGTLANELAQKGIDVVVLEAGAHNTQADFKTGEWDAFHLLS
jgi:choline dehydrogenase-like flavoprotein